MISISLITNRREIINGILLAGKKEADKILLKTTRNIKNRLSAEIGNFIKNTPEYESLMTGSLKADFGLADATPAIKKIASIAARSINITLIPTKISGQSLKGGFTVNMLKSDLMEIINIPEGSYQGKNSEIPWLKWLLTEGDRIIIAGYHVKYDLSDAERKSSLTGVAIMEKGGGWRVPPQFSGTLGDNWLTRAFDWHKIKLLLDKIVKDSFNV